MSNSMPPHPAQFNNLFEWAREVYEHMISSSPVNSDVDPTPLLLPHRTPSILERAVTSGVMMYDAQSETPVIAIGDKWEPIRPQPLFKIDYDTASAVNGSALAVGANKIPFDVQEIDLAPWATFDGVNNEFTLQRGRYQIDGFVSLSKVSGGVKTFTGYLAETSALTTPVGTVRMGTVNMAAAASVGTMTTEPFSGQVTVASPTTYAMIVNASASGVDFGTAHGIVGFTNVFARLTCSLVGLNE